MRGMNLRVGATVLAAIIGSALWSCAAWSAPNGAAQAARSYPQDAAQAGHSHPHGSEYRRSATGGDHKGSGGLPTPVVGAHELMELFNEPLFEDLKEAMQREAKDEEQWERLEHLGIKTAEIANLVSIRGGEHATAQPHEWSEYSTMLHEAGLELADAAETHDWQAVRNAYRGVVNACNACHDHFAPDHAPTLMP